MLALAACGGGDGVAGSLAEDSDSALFVSWTRHDDELAGVLTHARLVNTWSEAGIDVAVESADFTGVIDGDSVTLTFDIWSSWAPSRVVTGTLGGGTLALAVPAEDGLDIVRFEEGTSADFNAAVARLGDAAAEENDRAREIVPQFELPDD